MKYHVKQKTGIMAAEMHIKQLHCNYFKNIKDHLTNPERQNSSIVSYPYLNAKEMLICAESLYNASECLQSQMHNGTH